MKKRVVKDFDTTKDFSFIATGDNEDYFVHVGGLRGSQKYHKMQFQNER